MAGKKGKSGSSVSVVFLGLIVLTAFLLTGFYGCAGGAPKEESSGKSGGSSQTEALTGSDAAGAPETAPAGTAEEKEESGGGRASSAEETDDGFFTEFVEEPAAPEGGRGGSSDDSSTGADKGEPSPEEKLKEDSSATSARTGPTASASGLKAGFADDNKQYGYFINFLEKFKSTPHLPLDVSERIIFTVSDSAGKAVPNADVEILSAGRILESGKTLADGSYRFFPSEYPARVQDFTFSVTSLQQRKTVEIDRTGERNIGIRLETPRYIPLPIPLDIVFIMDTTGSMGEEIDRLRTTIELIHLNLSNLSLSPKVRFGMVLYKDIGDEYRTKTIPLTADLHEFQAALDLVEASGGGDTPEDLQAALEDTMKKIAWDPKGIKLGFIITDAPPHIDYSQEFDYTDASKAAKAKGIKIFSVGTGGLSLNGEYILRQISQYTAGKYIFLTYGEQGESEGGSSGSVSHHTGSNFQTDKLEAIIIRFAKEELSNLTDEPIDDGEAYFVAHRIDDEEREQTLNTLFSMALGQLVDYSTLRIETGTPTAVIPLISQVDKNKLDAEYFTERLLQQTITNDAFRVVERSDIQNILDELKLQLTGLTDSSQAVKVGELMNAEMLITGTLFKRDADFELFLKLLRVESGEVLSLTKAKIDAKLGLTDG